MRHFTLLFSILIFFINACTLKPNLKELERFAATEHFPEDLFLDTIANKKALVIVAHDDDDCAMSGTIAKLTGTGWEIKQLSLVVHQKADGSGQIPASLICTGNELILADGYYRLGLDTMKTPYLPIPYSEIPKQFFTKKVADSLIEKIQAFKPSVIFTLDNLKGGYGHPEHIFISQLVIDLVKTKQITVDRIYQSVFTDYMEEVIVDTWLKAKMEKAGYPHPSTLANELYGIAGMPEPNVQVTIAAYAEPKMAYLRAYPENVRKNLRKFLPYYEEYDPQTYFGIFDREFFRILDSESVISEL